MTYPRSENRWLQRVPAILRHFWADENGQDLIEYALLTAAIGFAGAAVWSTMDTTIGTVYSNNVDDANANWRSPEPSGP